MNINYHLINGWTHSHLHTRMQTLNSMITRSVPEYGTQYAKNFVFFIVEQPFFALFLSLSLSHIHRFFIFVGRRALLLTVLLRIVAWTKHPMHLLSVHVHWILFNIHYIHFSHRLLLFQFYSMSVILIRSCF